MTYPILMESHILTSNTDLKQLIDTLGLTEVDDEYSGQEFELRDEVGYFRIRANGHYLISSYFRHGHATNRTYKNDRIDEFVAVTQELYEEYLSLHESPA